VSIVFEGGCRLGNEPALSLPRHCRISFK
jgi:hypothetical protein